MITARLLPGVKVANWQTAIVVAIALGLANTVIRPVLVVLTLPVTILTLGLFTFVISALLVLLVSALIPGFTVANFWWALAFSLVLSLVHAFLHILTR